MYCKHCGKLIAADSKFCLECGGSILDVPEVPQLIEEEIILPEEPEPIITSETGGSEPGGLFQRRVVIAAFVIAAIIIAIALVMGWQYHLDQVDSDGDGVPDILDAFPNDKQETEDSDGDGWGDNEDAFPDLANDWLDSDGDGYGDNSDFFPNDKTEWSDNDGDGCGDNGDAFPNNSREWMDTDGDGYGDNGDAFPNNPDEWSDFDGDGHGDNSDAFPNENSEWADNDGDGTGDNADMDDDNDGVPDADDLLPFDNAIVKIDISKFTLLDEIDAGSNKGQIWLEVTVVGLRDYNIPESGEKTCERGIPWMVNTVLDVDVPDSSRTYIIWIKAYDYDSMSGADLIDLAPNGQRIIEVEVDIVARDVADPYGGDADGSGDGTGSSDDDDGSIEYYIEIIYE